MRNDFLKVAYQIIVSSANTNGKLYSIPEAVEDIDIGGVTLLRAAAKNFGRGEFTHS